MNRIVIALILILISFSALVAEFQKSAQWKRIVLMHSTRKDVESLLGPSKNSGYIASYPVEDGTLNVEYYPYRYCEPRGDADWNLPQWAVLELTYRPDHPSKLQSLKLDLSKFRKTSESFDAPDLVSYVNNEEGVDYTFQEDGTLNDIRYFPGNRYKEFRCRR
jgi:hypothetical protein